MAARAREFSIVYTTVDSREGVERIVACALDRKLAACVQVSEAESRYVWDGERRRTQEFVLTFKIKTADYADLAAAIREVHPYEAPEILRGRLGGDRPAQPEAGDETLRQRTRTGAPTRTRE